MAAYSRQKDIYSGQNKVSVQLLLFLHAHAALDVGAGSRAGHRTQLTVLHDVSILPLILCLGVCQCSVGSG